MTYGNFQTGAFDAALDRLESTKTVNERDPFIGEGEHVLQLLSLEPFNHKTHGPSVRASFEVLESSPGPTGAPMHLIGSRVTKLWFLTKPSKFETQTNDSDRFTDFIRQMAGAASGSNVAAQCRALIRDRVSDQLLRGMVIRARGVNTSKNAAKPWVEVYWTTVQQTPDQIKSRRATIEAKIAAAPVQQPAPAVQQLAAFVPQQYAPQPPPPGYGQPMHPQMPQQYAQPMQTQVLPQTPSNMPQMMPVQYAPQPQAPQQYAPQPQAPAAAPAAPAAPGGLLSQIPGF